VVGLAGVLEAGDELVFRHDRCRKKRVDDLVTRVRRELQRPLRIADQLVGQRLRYGHAARNRGSSVAKMMGKERGDLLAENVVTEDYRQTR
jgi:hypothetical protein